VLAIHKDPLFVAGERIFKSAEGAQVWTRPLSGGDFAAVLYNSNNNTALPISLSWTDLGWNNEDSVVVRDLWAKADVGTFQSGFSSEVAIHDALMLRLTRK
jgi:alpha-galactosidase